MLAPTDGGEPREIDILIEHHVGPHPVRIAIECRDHKRKQGIEWIEALRGKYEHLPVHKVVAVSRSGFAKTAEAAAAHVNIATATLQEAFEADWPDELARYRIGLIIWYHPLRATEVNYKDGPKLDISGDELLASLVQDARGQTLGTFADDVKHLYRTFVPADVRKWAQENAKELLQEPEGHVWPLRLPYTAHNRFLVPPRGPKRQINEVILCLDCSYRFEPAQMGYHRYHGAIVGTGEVERAGDPNRYTFSLLLDDSGSPKALNVHYEPKALREGNAV